MKTPKFTKKEFWGIKNPKWWHQETTAVFQLSYPWMIGFVTLQKYFKKGYEVAIIPLRECYGWHFLDEKKSIELAQHVISEYQKDHQYIQKIINTWRTYKQQMERYFKRIDSTDLTKLTNQELLQLYDSYLEVYIEEFTPALVAEAFEPFTTEVFYPQFTKMNKEQRRLLSILEQPEFRSFITDQQVSMLELSLYVQEHPALLELIKKSSNSQELMKQIKKKYSPFARKLQQHADNFYWAKNNYKDTKVLTPLFFLNILKQDIKKKNRHQLQQQLDNLQKSLQYIKKRKKEIINELQLDKKTIATFEVINQIGQWHDKRKKMMLLGNHYLNVLLHEVSRRTNYTLREVHYMHPNELRALLSSGTRMSKKLLHERRKFCIWIGGPDAQEYWFSGDEAEKIATLFFKKRSQEKRTITGIAAAPGTVTGNVRIVLDPHKDTIKEGEILVCPQTRPEFLHLMQKARAIVTNEGGLTCHAAIVSRELGIPCVVGTKEATTVLKNGDTVEVRAHRGEISKL